VALVPGAAGSVVLIAILRGLSRPPRGPGGSTRGATPSPNGHGTLSVRLPCSPGKTFGSFLLRTHSHGSSHMTIVGRWPTVFDPEELELLYRIFDDVWLALESAIDPAMAQTACSFIATAIIHAAVQGERDRELLWCQGMRRARALIRYWNSQATGF
jgi:hypothetical protein